MIRQHAPGWSFDDPSNKTEGWGQLHIDASCDDQTLTVRLEGDLDIYTTGELHQELQRMEPGQKNLVIDLSGLKFIDCAGLHELVELRRRAESRGGILMLVGVPEKVHRVIVLTGLERAFHIKV